MPNAFKKPIEHYQRRLAPVEQTTDHAAFYLHKETGRSYDECLGWVKAKLKGNGFPNLKNPTLRFYEREANGDRCVKEASLLSYIRQVIDSGDILVPTFTVYDHPSRHRSVLVDYLDEKGRLRALSKKAAARAEAIGNIREYIQNELDQKNQKGEQNSVSGLFRAEGVFLNNPSAHSTLTTMTRMITSFGNALNEKFMAGNRHYWSPEVTLNNLVAACRICDLVAVEQVMTRHQLHYPSAAEVETAVFRSSEFYWSGRRAKAPIRSFIRAMSPVERAAFLYTGDLYHLRVLNDRWTRDFLEALSRQVVIVTDDPIARVKAADEAVLNLAHLICLGEVEGKGKEYEVMLADGSIHAVVGTIQHIESVLEKYADVIQTFFISELAPASAAYLPRMIRRNVAVGDTDSTCAALEEWVIWHQGQMSFDAQATALTASVMYLAVESLIHVLALFSANLNAERKHLFTLAMKSEWYWPMLAVTPLAKHYFAGAKAREGSVFKGLKLEKKGVHLISAKGSMRIFEKGVELMTRIIESLYRGELIHLKDYLDETIAIERLIETSLLNGELEFFQRTTIQDKEAYKNGETTPAYLQYLMWKEAWEFRYGPVEPPPTPAIKVSTTLDTKSKVADWLNGMADQELSERLKTTLAKQGKKDLTTLYLPLEYVEVHGLPKEVLPIIDVERATLNLCKRLYTLLATLGFYKKPEYRLCDYYTLHQPKYWAEAQQSAFNRQFEE